jgi:hypothetical protein
VVGGVTENVVKENESLVPLAFVKGHDESIIGRGDLKESGLTKTVVHPGTALRRDHEGGDDLGIGSLSESGFAFFDLDMSPVGSIIHYCAPIIR